MKKLLISYTMLVITCSSAMAQIYSKPDEHGERQVLYPVKGWVILSSGGCLPTFNDNQGRHIAYDEPNNHILRFTTNVADCGPDHN